MTNANNTKTNQIEMSMTHKQAKTEGVRAYRTGKQSAPVHNQPFIEGACASSNDTVLLFKSYKTGWTIAMLADGATDPTTPSVKALAKLGL